MKDVKILQRILRRTTKFLLQDYPSDYRSRLVSLNVLPTLCTGYDCRIFYIGWNAPTLHWAILARSVLCLVHFDARSTAKSKLRVNFNGTSLLPFSL